MFGNRQCLTAILTFIFANTLYADGYFLRRDAITSGGGYSSSQSFILKDAIGQSVIGKAQNTGYIEQVGFYSYFVMPLVGIDEQKEAIPMVFSLSQNFPNPVNTKTTIRFTVAKTCYVSIKVYDIVGRAIKSLVNEEKRPGWYEASWDKTDNMGSKLGSGIYFIVMDVASFRDTKKIVVVK